MFTVESILSMKKADHKHQLESVGDGDDSGRESMSDIDPGEEGNLQKHITIVQNIFNL